MHTREGAQVHGNSGHTDNTEEIAAPDALVRREYLFLVRRETVSSTTALVLIKYSTLALELSANTLSSAALCSPVGSFLVET